MPASLALVLAPLILPFALERDGPQRWVRGDLAEVEVPVLEPHPDRAPDPWNLTLFVGQHDESTFLEMLGLDGGELGSSYLAGFALARPVGRAWGPLAWEVEISSYSHWGLQDHVELNLALIARWHPFPWDRWLDTSVAVGNGVSLASSRPVLEGDTRRFLHHLVAEVEVRPPWRLPVSLVTRVHHRSGAFGLYGIKAGSNFVTLGLRFQL